MAVSQFTTDSTGLLRLDPEQLGTKKYALRATSLTDGSLKQSAAYASGGSQRFVVGSAGVVIRVADRVSGAYLSGLEVQAYEKRAGGQKVQVAKRSTDGEGLVKFDLDGLGEGKAFVFHTQPYGQWVISDEVSSATNYRLWVGKLQVQVINGQNGQPLAGQEVVLRRWRASGAHEYEAVATSDAQGWVKLDPQSMGTEPYVVTAPSATDGQMKVSEAYRTAGPHRFVVGNPAVRVSVRDAVGAAVLPQVWVEAWERLAGGQEVLSLKRQTDASGVVKFDLDGVGSGRKYVFKAQPYLQPIQSAEVTSAADVVLRAGQLQVQLIDGRTGAAYTGQNVELLDVSSGNAMAVSQFTTDSTGLLRLDPEQLGTKKYALRATSLTDGSLKQSANYQAAGSFVFRVGGEGLTVRLVDYVTEANLTGYPVQAVEQLPGGGEQLRDTRVTDVTGLVRFDLDGLGTGKRFVVRAQPYGFVVESEVIAAAGTSYRLHAGSSPVTLLDADSGGVLAAVQLIAHEKRPDGTLGSSSVAGTTGTDGVVRFNLTGLGTGSVYLFEARNPFGDGESYFSQPLSVIGSYSFAIARGNLERPDQTRPEVSISSPMTGKRVAFGGFLLDGMADDAEGLASVRIELRLPSGTKIERSAIYRPTTRTWSAVSGELPATESGVLTVTVIATDKALNQGRASIDLSLLPDSSPPRISDLSHPSGADVPRGGFSIHGRIDDESLAPKLSVEISGGGTSSSTPRSVEVDQTSGRWSLVVTPDERFDSAGLAVKLTARDAAGNQNVQTLMLSPSERFEKTWHALLRTSFGVSHQAYEEALASGVEAYLQQQLSPASVSDEAYLQHQANWSGEGTELSTSFLRRAVFSDRQLLEVMTWFWDNHFNTNYATHVNSTFETEERHAFRSNALGNFRTLLGVSAKSPAMLYTLDGRLNRKGIPNENYARELMELHTLGVDGGYTQGDVQEVARALTGWTVKDGVFYFSDVWHDFESKTVLGLTLAAGGGMSDGEQVLDWLAEHPSTARFICFKLIQFFVADSPPASLLSRCANVFSANAGSSTQIAMVISEIFRSSEFLDEQYRQSKIKTPLEFVVGAVRNLNGEFKADDLGIEIARQGMMLFRNPVPTGYADVGTSWVTTGMLHARARFSERLLKSTLGEEQTQFSLADDLERDGIVTSEGVAGRLLERLLGPGFARRHLDLALRILTEDGSYPWRPGAADREERARQLGRMLMNFPSYHYQ
jgi:large repetitive protein